MTIPDKAACGRIPVNPADVRGLRRPGLTGNPNLALATQFELGNGQVFGSAQRTASSIGTSPGRPRSRSVRHG